MTPEQIRERLEEIARADFGFPNTAKVVTREPDHRIARVARRIGHNRSGHSDAARMWRRLARDLEASHA